MSVFTKGAMPHPRISEETLDELIEHKGTLKHVCLNADGVLRLALDLHDALARVVALEAYMADHCDCGSGDVL